MTPRFAWARADAPSAPRAFACALQHLPVVDSTNDTLAEWARAGAPHGAVVLADMQRRGRGRQGRGWHSPRGGLYASLLLRPPAAALSGFAPFSAIAALAVAEAVGSGGGCPAQLKWPNDVWAGGRKLAGILLESRAAPEPTVLVGIGANLQPPLGGWPPDLHVPATALGEWGDVRSAPQLLSSVLELLEPAYAWFLREGFSPFQSAWRERSLLDGQPVLVQEGGAVWRAVAEGVDHDGRLIVHTPEGQVRTLVSGEVHLEVERGT